MEISLKEIKQPLSPSSNAIKRVFLSFAAVLVFLVCGALTASSQNYRVLGKIIDKTDNQPVIGAFVFLTDVKDTTERIAATTDVNGKFLLTNLKKKSYRLTIQSINYQRDSRIIELTGPTTDLGTISLAMESKVLNEVVVVGQGTAVQKGDTTSMSADAFKVNQDASAEDLVKKMPGITVENGTVKARGEDVKQVLVDGKPFFGDDPSVALRNLPADVIERVQVYNRLSDQAELTGFDDGESSRTINIITKRSSKYSTFGKATVGTNFSDKYLAGGNLNLFSGPRRFTFTGMTNNINQQNFAMQDLIGSTGGQGQRGGFGGRSFGGSSGISETSSLGFNYQDTWGKKIAVSGSYFFNTIANTTIIRSDTKYLLIEDGNFFSDSSYNTSSNNNHRVNMRLEYKIDTMNTVIMVPRFSYQENSSNNQSIQLISGGSVFSQTLNSSVSDAAAYNVGNDLTWNHKFLKKGRTLSVRSSISFDKRATDNTQLATIDSIPDNQFSDNYTDNLTINTNFSYTEPLGKNGQLQVNYNNNFRRSNNSQEKYQLGDESEILGRMDSLSNVYDNDYIRNRGGLGYLYKKGKLNLTAGLNYENAILKGTQTFPKPAEVSEIYQGVLPNFMINYKFSDITNLRVFYRTETDAPSVVELQSAIDNSNRNRLRTGNPGLKQEYSHRLMSNFSYANPTSGFNAFVFLMGQYASNVITNRTIYAEGDTLVQPEGIDVTLYPGSQITYPVNLDKSMRLNTMINLGYFVKPIKSNVSLVLGAGYSQSPEYVETLINRSNAYNVSGSLIVTSNISSNVDFTVSYTSMTNLVKNSVDMQKDTKYWYQSASAKLNLVLWKGITVNTDVVGQYNRGLSEGYDEKYFVWNASIGKKFLKSQAAEFKIGAYDILDQNRSVYRTVTASSITDTRVNAYRRYFLVLFTYNLRSQRGQQGQQQQQQDTHDHPPGVPQGVPPGVVRPPGGGPPGGYHDH
jgi:hypothetical protein